VTSPSRSATVIEAVGLTKKFGAVTALKGVDLTVRGGESVALFGPNGAGKTTLIRILTLGLRLGGGTLRIADLDPRANDLEIRRLTGVISHQSFLYDSLTAAENLEFFAGLYGVRDPVRRSAELLDTVDLAHRANDLVGTFSRGMQQRVSLARALVHDPAIVFLDEPFTGLDPQAARKLRATLEELRRQGRTVLMATHNLRRGLELSDRWLILSRGRVVDSGVSAETDLANFEDSYFDRLARGTNGKNR
jgi:heme exporter protein A